MRVKIIQIALVVLLMASALTAAKTLDMYVVDVEGGKSLLLVSPSGQSMVIDAGNPGSNGRDANRIVEACKAAGVKAIDFMVVAHYDSDHVANVPTLLCPRQARSPTTTLSQITVSQGMILAIPDSSLVSKGRLKA